MAFWFPPPPPFMGGSQPHAPRELPADLSKQSVNEPPYTFGGPVNAIQEIAYLAYPNPWTYQTIIGQGQGAQPYGIRKLNPQDIANPVNEPPYVYGGPVATMMAIVMLAQPNPWTYNFLGTGQPFAPLRLPPGIPGFSLDPPPTVHPEQTVAATIIKQSWQPPDWPHVFIGARQAYAPRWLPPSITNVAVNNPPFDPRRIPQLASLVVAWQPPPPLPWVPTYTVKFSLRYSFGIIIG